MRYIPLCFVVGLVLAACAENETPGGDNLPPTFFDLATFMREQIDSLAEQPITVDKTIELNGKIESHEMSDVNFANDLRVFREADINKPAWVEKYRADTQRLSASHMIMTYTALDSSLQTQTLKVEKDRGQVRRIEIQRRTGTVLSDGRHELWYEPARGYTVRTRQDNRFGEDVDAVIDVRWK